MGSKLSKLLDTASLAKPNSNVINLILMNKDKEVLTFKHITEDEDSYFEEVSIYGVLPIGYEDIDSWLRLRRSPVSRRQLTGMLSRHVSLIEYVLEMNAVSLNDTFWVKESNSTLEWKDVSPYNGVISEDQSYGIPNGIIASPEFSTHGVFPKCWLSEGSSIYLIKGGTEENKYIEPMLESIASIVYNSICDNAVEYSVYSGFKTPADKSLLFTSEDVGMISLAQYTKKQNLTIREIRNILSEFDKSDLGLFNSMLVSDMITLNTDRHLGNVGLYIENDTQKIIGMSKVYDYNRCFIPELSSYQYADKDVYDKILRNQLPRLGNDFISVAIASMSSHLRDRLSKLVKDFSLSGIIKDDYWRKEQIEEVIKGNINLLLKS